MSEELKLTLTPDTAAAAAPALTLEPDAAQDQSAEETARKEREANAVKVDESMLTEAERKMVHLVFKFP